MTEFQTATVKGGKRVRKDDWVQIGSKASGQVKAIFRIGNGPVTLGLDNSPLPGVPGGGAYLAADAEKVDDLEAATAPLHPFQGFALAHLLGDGPITIPVDTRLGKRPAS